MEDSNNSNFVLNKLTAWSLDEYADNFKKKGINDKEKFLKIKPRDAKEIFGDTHDELTFWRKWAPLCAENVLHEHHEKKTPSNKKESSQNTTAIRASLFQEITPDKILEILMRHHLTRSVLKSYEKKQNLEYETIVVETIVSDLIDINSQYWNNEHFEVIANSIVEIFKSETKETYYVAPVKNKSATGKIPDRFRNFVQKCRDISGETKKRGKIAEDSDSSDVKRPKLNDRTIRECLNWLKTRNGTFEETQEYWQNTFEYRLSWMQLNSNKTVEKIYDEWPVLKLPNAWELILQDFDRMLSLKVRGSIWNWSKFIDYVNELKKCSNYDTQSKRIMNLLDDEATTQGGRTMLELVYLVHLFPPKRNADSKKKPKRKSNVASSISDIDNLDRSRGSSIQVAKDCFVITAKTSDDISDIKRKRIEDADESFSVQPYIITLSDDGQLHTATDFLVVLDNYHYHMKSGLEAIDLCFKIFHVMLADYPSSTSHIWQLIERGVYKFNSKKMIIPNMEKFYKSVEEKDYIEIHEVKCETDFLFEAAF